MRTWPVLRAPRVSVISIFYNRAPTVEASVRSLLEQTYENLEIVLVDDGSPDDTYAELLRFEADPRVVVRTQPNQGFTPTMRQAVEDATGDVIAVHGSGDLSASERIARQVEALEADPSVVAVGCWYRNVDADTGATVDERRPVLDGDLLEQVVRANPFSHGEVTFRRDAYATVGGYREAFRYSQDFDLWLRMALVGRFAVVPDDLYTRFHRADGVSRLPEKTLVQQMLREFAVQCVRQRQTEGSDWIDRHGPAGLLFWKPSPAMARSLLRQGRRDLLAGKPGAAHVVRLGARHRWTPAAAGLAALATLAERAPAVADVAFRVAGAVRDRKHRLAGGAHA